MGIKNLLCFLKPFIKPIHIGKYSGKRVGIDAYSWLHKGAYSCSMDLCLNLKTENSKRYLKYFMHRINLLKHYEITPVVVFDGGSIPCKSATENDRHRRREANLEIAKRKHKEGNETASIEFFQVGMVQMVNGHLGYFPKNVNQKHHNWRELYGNLEDW